jgi:HK97 family phage portal protein
MFERLRSALWPPDAVPELRAGVAVHTATDYGRDILQNQPDGWEVDNQWLWWVDGPGAGTPNGFGNPPPDARDGNGSGASSIPAVMRCTAIIADTIAGLPWRVYRGFEQMPTPRWVTDPQGLRPDGRVPGYGSINADAHSAVEFYAQWITSAVWFGDGFIWAPRGRDDNMQPIPPLYILNPCDIDYHDNDFYVGESRIDPAELIHLRGEPPYKAGKSDGVIQRYGADLGLAAALRTYATNVFSSGIPAGYIKVNSPQVTQAQATDLKRKWLEQHGGPRRSIAVLNATTEFHPIAISPVDSQLDTAKVWSLRDIALAFGVPAYMLGVPGDSSTYANVESRMTELRTFTLLPWIRRIEAAMDALFPAGTELKIITDGTLRADTSTRYASYESALRSGWMTVDEVRALEDRPPLPEQVSTAPEDTLPTIDPAAVPDPAIPEPVPSES